MNAHKVSKGQAQPYEPRLERVVSASSAVNGADLLFRFITEGGKPYKGLNSCAKGLIQAGEKHRSGEIPYHLNIEVPEGPLKDNSEAAFLSSLPGALPYHEQSKSHGVGKVSGKAKADAANGVPLYHDNPAVQITSSSL